MCELRPEAAGECGVGTEAEAGGTTDLTPSDSDPLPPDRRWVRDGVCLYVVGATHTGPLKIGITTSPDSRLASLQTGNHEKLSLFTYIVIPDKSRWIEKTIHESLGLWRLHGEWFNISLPCAIEAIYTEFLKHSIDICPGSGVIWDEAFSQVREWRERHRGEG